MNTLNINVFFKEGIQIDFFHTTAFQIYFISAMVLSVYCRQIIIIEYHKQLWCSGYYVLLCVCRFYWFAYLLHLLVAHCVHYEFVISVFLWLVLKNYWLTIAEREEVLSNCTSHICNCIPQNTVKTVGFFMLSTKLTNSFYAERCFRFKQDCFILPT